MIQILHLSDIHMGSGTTTNIPKDKEERVYVFTALWVCQEL
jgi:DNA repair exonuclease SbcCD nuclease subunit